MARRRFRFRAKKVNIPRVVSKLAGTILALYAGGLIVITLGNVMENTTSPFYNGLTLIGWTVGTRSNATSLTDCSVTAGTGITVQNCITATTGAGVLAVVGLIGIASIVMEFVEFRLK